MYIGMGLDWGGRFLVGVYFCGLVEFFVFEVVGSRSLVGVFYFGGFVGFSGFFLIFVVIVEIGRKGSVFGWRILGFGK